MAQVARAPLILLTDQRAGLQGGGFGDAGGADVSASTMAEGFGGGSAPG